MGAIRTRVSIVFIIAAVFGCNQGDSDQESDSASPAAAQAAFVNKVWSVVESPAGATGELYVFLSTGTLVIASPEARPSLGRWSWESGGLTMVEGGLPYNADIVALEDSVFSIRIRNMGKSWDLRLVPAGHAMPDTTRAVEFNPAENRILADGKEPFWHLEVDGSSALLYTRGEKRAQYDDGVWIQVDAPSWQYEAQRKRGDRKEVLQLTITRSLCVDSESGAESPLHATLVLNGRRMNGCALAGRSLDESGVK
jgi:uncharacterized membrane protein